MRPPIGVAYCLTKHGLVLMHRQPHRSAIQCPASWLTLLQHQPGDLVTSVCFSSHVSLADTSTLDISGQQNLVMEGQQWSNTGDACWAALARCAWGHQVQTQCNGTAMLKCFCSSIPDSSVYSSLSKWIKAASSLNSIISRQYHNASSVSTVIKPSLSMIQWHRTQNTYKTHPTALVVLAVL